MGTTVSRRLVFVKMKRKQLPPKPKHFLSASDRDTRIGEGHHSSATFVALNQAIPPRPMSIWMAAGWSVLGLCALVGIVAALINLTGNGPTVEDETSPPSSQSAPPGYSQAAGGGHSGASGGAGYATPKVSAEQRFLNTALRKH